MGEQLNPGNGKTLFDNILEFESRLLENKTENTFSLKARAELYRFFFAFHEQQQQ